MEGYGMFNINILVISARREKKSEGQEYSNGKKNRQVLFHGDSPFSGH
jgi:hypothetical protein